MKNSGFTVIVLLLLSSFTSFSQSYSKGDMLLSLKAGIVTIVKNENADSTWEGTPVSATFEYMLLNKNNLTLGVGLNATYFRHQPNNSNYGVMGIGLPVSLHYNFFPRATAFVGYMPGWYIDGYKPESNSANSGYEGLYSELFIGVRYFVINRLAVYTQLSTGDFRLNLGVSLKI